MPRPTAPTALRFFTALQRSTWRLAHRPVTNHGRCVDRRSVCSCTHPDWPLPSPSSSSSSTAAKSDPLAVDYTGHLTQIKPIGRHILIETPKRGAWDWTPNTLAESSSETAALPAVVDRALLKGGSHHKAEPDPFIGGRLLFNRYATTLQAAARDADGSGSGEDVEYGKVLILPDGIELSVDLSSSSTPTASPTEGGAAKAAALLDILHASPSNLPKLASAHGVPHTVLTEPLFFVCGHMGRDARCGKTAPVLRAAIASHLQERGVTARLGYVDHIGGHKFAGNLLCYLPNTDDVTGAGAGSSGNEDVQVGEARKRYTGVWYGRVHLDNLAHVLNETLAGRIVGEMVRLRV